MGVWQIQRTILKWDQIALEYDVKYCRATSHGVNRPVPGNSCRLGEISDDLHIRSPSHDAK